MPRPSFAGAPLRRVTPLALALIAATLAFFAWQQFYPVRSAEGWSYRALHTNVAKAAALALDGSGALLVSEELNDGQVTHEHRSDDHVLVNPNAEYKLIEGLALSGYVKNLFDEKYVTNNRAGEPVNIIDVGAPRTLGLVLRYDL